MNLLPSEATPVPRDVAMICLADACVLWCGMIYNHESGRLKAWIGQFVTLDLIGHSVARTTRELPEATRDEEARWFS